MYNRIHQSKATTTTTRLSLCEPPRYFCALAEWLQWPRLLGLSSFSWTRRKTRCASSFGLCRRATTLIGQQVSPRWPELVCSANQPKRQSVHLTVHLQNKQDKIRLIVLAKKNRKKEEIRLLLYMQVLVELVIQVSMRLSGRRTSTITPLALIE